MILGVFVADTTYRAARQPRLGETILGEGFALGPGGKGSNQAVACARAGVETHLITRLGRDAFGEMARRLWAEAGVTGHARLVEPGQTGAACILVEAATGDNAIIICPGVAGGIEPGDLDAEAGLIGSASVFVTQLEQPLAAARHGLALARAAGVATVLDPAPATRLEDAMLALVDHLTPNETEAEALTGIAVTDLAGAEAAGRALLARGVGRVVVTLGPRGALLVGPEGAQHVPAFDAGPVMETTGAGDAFTGVFAAALAEGQTPLEAVRFGCAAAAISVTRPGTAASMPMRAEIDALLACG